MKKLTSILNDCTLFFVLMFMFLCLSVNAALVHPGLSHKKSDLDRMKYQVQAKIEPYYSSYLDLCSKNTASYNYTVQGDLTKTVVYRDSPRTNLSIFESDSRAAYYNALRYYIEGDERYAKKAVECLNAWTGLTYVQYSGTAALTSNVVIIMLEAAELIKSIYPGWSAEEIKKFSDMLVYPGYSNTTIPSNLSTDGTWYWRAYKFDPIRAGNQELCGIRTTMAIGIFLDDERIYDRAWRYINKMPGRTDDIPFPKGPHVRTAVSDSNQYRIAYNVTELSTESNFYGNGALTNYVYENGQCQESSRDQAHTSFGLGVLCGIAEYAWNQGDDLYSAENFRILTGIEYSGKYNVTYFKSYPDQLTPWEPTVASGEFMIKDDATLRNKSLSICPFIDNCDSCLTRGQYVFQDTWELPIGHYVGRGFKTSDDVKWTIRVRDYYKEASGKYETGPTGGAYVGFGGLSFRRPDGCYGDPISGFKYDTIPVFKMNVAPCTIEAENFDYFPINAEGKIYHDADATNTSGKYRTDQGVDIDDCSEGGYQVNAIADGEWMTYSIAIPKAGYYNIDIRYAAASGNGKIKFAVGNVDKTAEVPVPFGGSYSTGIDNWSNFRVASQVFLQAGVQALKVTASGTSNSFALNNITVTEELNTIHVEAESYTTMSGVSTMTCTDVNGGLNLNSLDVNDWVEYEIYVPNSQNYFIDLRLASLKVGNYALTLDGVAIDPIAYEVTGSSDVWVTKRSTVSYPMAPGKHILRIKATVISSFLNWINLVADETTCSQTPVSALFSTYNTSNVLAETSSSNSIYVIPGYTLKAEFSPATGGTWSVTGPNGFSSTRPEIEFDKIEKAQDGTYTATYTNSCGTSTTATYQIHVSDSVQIEAESYSSMSGVTTTSTTDIGGGSIVTGIDANDYLEFTVDVPYTGNYLIDYRVAGATAGSLSISSGTTLLENVSFNATGSDQTWSTVQSTTAVFLTKGSQTMRITAKSAGWNINWIKLNLQNLVKPCAFPYTFDNLSVSSETKVWSSGLINISCVDNVNVFMDITATGTMEATDYLKIYYKLNNGEEVVISENIGALTTSKLNTIGLKGKTLELIIKASTGNSDNVYNINNIKISTPPVFGVIQAESFYSMNGIQTQTTSDTGAGLNVGWINNGDWLLYKDVDITGANSFNARLASKVEGTTIEMHIDSVNGALIATMPVIKTGGDQSWKTNQKNIIPTNGIHDIYLVFKGVGTGYLGNFNWFQFSTVVNVESTGVLNTRLNNDGINLKHYPSPVHNKLTVNIENYNFSDWTVYNLSGIKVKSGAISTATSKLEVDFESLSKGYYVVSLQGEQGLSSFKVIKN